MPTVPFFTALFATVIGSSLLNPAGLFPAEVKSLTVLSYPNRPAKLPLWLAQEAGLFGKNGLQVSLKELNSSEAAHPVDSKARRPSLCGYRQLAGIGRWRWL